MIDVCHAMNEGDWVCKIVHRLRPTAMMLSMPHNKGKHQPMDVLPEMMEFYDIFRVLSKGSLQTLLSTTMPLGILDVALRSGQDTARDVLTEDMCQIDVGGQLLPGPGEWEIPKSHV